MLLHEAPQLVADAIGDIVARYGDTRINETLDRGARRAVSA
jgi:hypothetical protein